MLVLTRKTSERIHIGDNVVVKVIRLGRNTVKIGIEAPEHVRVLRSELCDDTPPAPKLDPAQFAGDDAESLVMACSDQFPFIA
jgi:carbon storage regulator